MLLLAACSPGPGASSSPAAAPPAAEDHQAFLERHWQRPLAPQGKAPAGVSPQEASLDPAACGTCHQSQFEDWKTALHSRAMGPGLFGQLQEMAADAVDDHQACLRCHAPLAEQEEHLQQALAASPRSVPPRPDGAAYAHGLTCAGCHVREQRRFGPARRDGSGPGAGEQLPHAGWQVSAAFEDSRFCAACHQFESDGPALNGKLLENTYEEWRASRHAKEQRTCQSCHMPDRRHLWRGIHDPEMVKSGLGIETSAPAIAGGDVSSELRIANQGVGHAFPTYVTPHVLVEIGQADGHGALVESTVERHLIARDVSLDLTTEHADTRILPDEVRRYSYRGSLHPQAVALAVRIKVEPDAFYADFYRATLRDPDFKKGRAAISQALRHAEQSSYVLYESRQALPARPTRSMGEKAVP
ncbi:multiheme c-type cytochrome [Azoarcus sp. DN11]|uniref:multiheme c-type cytochrome n=1 Tax=Azoarcus sp. DN11 TaxID=356837 RepID=UPI0013E37807|nr:multiheme c-type cytochrome [Azoarcus sp. DN11]